MPWCVQKCPYCDFNSHNAGDSFDESKYIDALIRDLETELAGVWGRKIVSIFIGGGTPSLFSSESIAQLISSIRALFAFAPETEITLEANPGTVDSGKFSGLAEAGINRLSIGIQSFNDEHLRTLGRIHNSSEAIKAVEIAKASAIKNINLDLMFGLPEQTEQQALDDINRAIDLSPQHISLYQLTIEPNTLFHHHPPTLPDDDLIWDMQVSLQRELASAGYTQYEISAYARKNYQCQHNINYWQFGDYIGIGAGAHGKISSPEGIIRKRKSRHPVTYMKSAGTMECVTTNPLGSEDLILEFMMNALRLTNGVPVALFQDHTGQPFNLLERQLRTAEDRGLIERDARWLKPTELGRRYLNDLLQIFTP